MNSIDEFNENIDGGPFSIDHDKSVHTFTELQNFIDTIYKDIEQFPNVDDNRILNQLKSLHNVIYQVSLQDLTVVSAYVDGGVTLLKEIHLVLQLIHDYNLKRIFDPPVLIKYYKTSDFKYILKLLNSVNCKFFTDSYEVKTFFNINMVLLMNRSSMKQFHKRLKNCRVLDEFREVCTALHKNLYISIKFIQPYKYISVNN